MKTKKAQRQKLEGMPCFECENGTLHEALQDYSDEHPKLGKFTVANVPVQRCDECDELLLTSAGGDMIDAYLDKALNAISPEEIQALLSKYSLTQKAASKVTGLGEKNISRWLSGRSRPSESVSNLLRLLLADETTFERLKQKNFSEDPAQPYPAEIRQPDAEEKEVLKCVDYPKLVSLKLVTKAGSPKEKRSQLCALAKCQDLIEFRSKTEQANQQKAAFKDTSQKSNAVSSGLWAMLGEQAATKIATEPYDRTKLRKAVKQLREFTHHPLESIVPEVKSILAGAGVALVIVPIMKQSALRGCTKLLTPNKAMIIHGLKFRSLSQFWIVLFHEIAHLLLHISKPGEVFVDYEDQVEDPKEQDADIWAWDTLVSLDRQLELSSNNPELKPRVIESFAKRINIHPALVIEIFNKRAGKEVISYSFMKKKNLFPQLSESETEALQASTIF